MPALDGRSVDARAPDATIDAVDAAIDTIADAAADAAIGMPDDAGPIVDAAIDATPVDAMPDAAPPPIDCGPMTGTPCGPCGVVSCVGSPDHLICAPNGSQCDIFSDTHTVDWPTGVAHQNYAGGIAFGDLDGDDQVDAVISGPDRLRVMRGDGSGGFAEQLNVITGAAPADIRGVVLVDYDGDGDLDLSATAEMPTEGLFLFQNDGAGTFAFHDGLQLEGVTWPGGPAWADYDGDGYLDVFVPAYVNYPSRLFRNLGGTAFQEVGTTLGVDNPAAASLQGLWLDYDLDGDQDLFIANDKGQGTGQACSLYRNNGDGTFADVGVSAGITHLVHGMGAAAGDFDGDGDLDIHVTVIGWVVDGQLLYVNLGNGTFAQRAHIFGAQASDYFGWGSEFADLDNDGDLDLIFASQYPEQPWLGERIGNKFVDLTPLLGFHPQGRIFGVNSADFDRDGRLDFGWRLRELDAGGVPMHLARFTRNITPNTGHWLRVALQGPAPNTRAIGALIRVQVGTGWKTRHLSAGTSFLGSSEQVAHFGLGAAATVDAIEVRWPGGPTAVYPGPWPVDQSIVLSPP